MTGNLSIKKDFLLRVQLIYLLAITIAKAKKQVPAVRQDKQWDTNSVSVAHSLKKWHESTSSGVFALINGLFKLKQYKDKSADVHGKSYELVLLHQLLSKTAAQKCQGYIHED